MSLCNKSSAFKRKLSALLCLCLIFGMLGQWTVVQAVVEDLENEISYDFRNVGLDGELGDPVGWILLGKPSTEIPKVIKASYGVQLQTNPTNAVNNQRSFQLPVEEAGTYKVKFRGYQSTGGGLSEIFINGELIGHYDFYSAVKGNGPTVELDTKINLAAGTHQLTFKTISDSNLTPYMYPSELILVPMEPEFAYIDVEAPTRLLSGETGQLSVTGFLSNMEPVSLDKAVIQYKSSDESVIQVSQTGEVTALSAGTAEITTIVLLNSVIKEHVHSIEVFQTAGDIVVKEFSYDFRNVGLDGAPGNPIEWTLLGKPSTVVPKVIKASYGLQLQTNPSNAVNNQRSFQLPVEEAGTYKVKLRGYLTTGGELSELILNNQLMGLYNYYSIEKKDGPFVIMENKINLSQGNQVLTLKTISDSIYTPYMYPSELVLLQMLPELATVSVTSPTVLPVGNTIQLNITGTLSNMETADLETATIQFESSDESILVVSPGGEVTTLAPGSADIKTTVTLDGVSVEHVLSYYIIDGNLTGLEIFVDTTKLYMGRQMYVIVNGVSDTGKTIELNSGLIRLENSNPSVASLNNLGVLTAHEIGETVLTAKMLFAGNEIMVSKTIYVTQREMIPLEIPIVTNKWGIMESTSNPITLDGSLQDEAWGNVSALSDFVTIYENDPAELQTQVKVLYDQNNLYFGIKGDLNGMDDTQSEMIELILRLPGQFEEFYLLPLQIYAFRVSRS